MLRNVEECWFASWFVVSVLACMSFGLGRGPGLQYPLYDKLLLDCGFECTVGNNHRNSTYQMTFITKQYQPKTKSTSPTKLNMST